MSEPKIVHLVDSQSQSEAKISVEFGFNCYSFVVRQASQTCDVLWSDPAFPSKAARPSGSGIPLLFPFPGRIAEGVFTWRGKRYVLEPNDGRGNAIHGFVYTRPWRIVEQTADSVTGEFHAARDDAELLAFWPSDFRIRATYRIEGTSLESVYHIDNPSSEPLPCGFGTHPYFRVPLGGTDAALCRIRIPVHEEWELDRLLPTGIRFPIRDWQSFHEGLEFGAMQFDSVFSGLVFGEDGWCRTEIVDPQSGWKVTHQFDRQFSACVVYTPPHRQAVCIEPYSCVPNAIRLYSAGIPSGLRILQPGEEVTFRVRIHAELGWGDQGEGS
ncbi:MAG: hypothetical protein KatS3mg110_2396 [Pirellulaceae bacterium]|nr:MAG: hypothetical protein KatS3mg110_2396 [Pirellulaceae bacterium]